LHASGNNYEIAIYGDWNATSNKKICGRKFCVKAKFLLLPTFLLRHGNRVLDVFESDVDVVAIIAVLSCTSTGAHLHIHFCQINYYVRSMNCYFFNLIARHLMIISRIVNFCIFDLQIVVFLQSHTLLSIALVIREGLVLKKCGKKDFSLVFFHTQHEQLKNVKNVLM
jgi:hypothetical protein